MAINLFAIHYFLWFAAITSIYGYQSNYAEKYANASATQYGLLFMILPFVTIGSKLIFCSLADRHRAYRTFFVIFLAIALLGLLSYTFVPFLVNIKPYETGLNAGAFVMFCIIASLFTIAMSVISCLSDAFAMNSAKKYGTSYGMIRLWGTVAWGLSALLLSYINQSASLPQFVPGLIVAVALVSLDIGIMIIWRDADDFNLSKSASDLGVQDIEAVLASGAQPKHLGADLRISEEDITVLPEELKKGYGTSEEARVDQRERPKREIVFRPELAVDISSVKMQWILFKQVATRRKSIFRFMTLFTISGALISLQWSYFFLYLNKIYTSDFIFISSLSMVGQSFLGELPFFILSQYIIRLLGRSNTLSVSITSIGLRYLLYQYLLPNASMYFVLITEMFQGPNFGLYYVVMTEVGLDYSDCEGAIVHVVNQGIVRNDPAEIEKLRQALRATMQSLMSACYEGLGVGIGAIVGGLVIDNFGFQVLWVYAAAAAVLLGLVNVSVDIFGVSALQDRRPSEIFAQ